MPEFIIKEIDPSLWINDTMKDFKNTFHFCKSLATISMKEIQKMQQFIYVDINNAS